MKRKPWKPGPRLNLWALTRHPRVTLHEVQHRCPAFNALAHNRLARIASGFVAPASVTAAERLQVLTVLALLRVERPDGAADWFAPMRPALERSLKKQRPHGAVARRPVRGSSAFVSFTAGLGARGWDHWKKETRVPLTTDVLDHFGLKTDPFDKPRSSDARWRSAGLDRCARELRVSLLAGHHVILMGPSGAGKSDLARDVLERLVRERRAVVSRNLPPDKRRVSDYSLIAGVARDLFDHFCEPHHGLGSRDRASHTLRALVLRARAQGLMVVVLIEECHCLPEIVRAFIKRMMEANADGSAESMAVLEIGQTDPSAKVLGKPLRAVLEDPDNREATQRMMAIDVPPLGRSLDSYIAHRFERAGGDAGRILAEGCLPAIRRALPAERLVPGMVNKTLSDAMRWAQRLGDKKVTASHIDDARPGAGQAESPLEEAA